MASQTTVAIVAEKPSVARDIARVLKATSSGKGYLHGNGYVVTWAIGHLVALAQPADINPDWRLWRRERLPMIPESWPLVVGEQTKDQFEVVQKILTSPKVSRVICATDAGREGELIFRYIYEAAKSDKPFQRLWISSLTPEAIEAGFRALRPGTDYDPLADAARGRSRADWLVGMNLSRAYGLASGEKDVSVGRVQTPTLAMVVERELAIRNFVPEDYRIVTATFSPRQGQEYEGAWFRPGVEGLDAAVRLPPDGVEAAAVVERVKTGEARIESIEAQTKRMGPPLLYDLTELQRHANRLYGYSAQRTLEAAQALYEHHKLISYPRTDSRHLSSDVAKTLGKVVKGVSGPYAALLAPGTGERPLGKRFVDDTKVSDHHAMIPTGVSAAGKELKEEERKIYDLICRRLLSAWHEDHVWSVTTVITLVKNAAVGSEDRFHSSGTAIEQMGWKVLDIGGGKKREKKKRGGEEGDDDAEDGGQTLPPGLERGQLQKVVDVEAEEKKTRPPKRLTDATLLTAMETAGKTLDDKELSEAMKESGLGTPATRAQIIEVLLKREFVARKGKSLEATDKGIRLIEMVHPEVKSPAMTGQWEAYLKRIERGTAQLPPFIKGIEDYVRDVIGKVSSSPVGRAAAPEPVVPMVATRRMPVEAPVRPDAGLREMLQRRFGFSEFRPNQEAACQALVAGNDLLLVMPTGSGKSLCYQLPGIALGGTTLVVSPLIALMEDQVAKLASQGFAAERIHSGRDRATSREVCKAYLEGRLDFLFIAPERLRVQGFPEMLAKRRPVLVAIDEAHCISQWGHDFRPDYRNIGQHLPALRPAPVIALTATATPLVQSDIAQQLGLARPLHFIHGFRRENIAIEVVKSAPGARLKLAREILKDEGRRPAIVYTPRRRDAEELAGMLGRDYAAAAYHAGLEGKVRDRVQTGFLDNSVEVIVGTIAFGMGIDKPNVRTVIHTALPGSVEGYYQEIGRAGRDGAPSRAILMHSYADRFTHDHFFERDYPEASVLQRIYDRLTAELTPKEVVQQRAKLYGEEFDTALEKLWIHGGAAVDYAENISKGTPEWRALYLAQRAHKAAQFEKMRSYADSSTCRMLSLVGYFGDTADSNRRCEVCDICDAEATVAQPYREASAAERAQGQRILDALKKTDAMATGRLHALVFADGSLDRRGFEELIGGMARARLVDLTDASFEKDGKRIDFKKARISGVGREATAETPFQMPLEVEKEARSGRKKKAAPKGKKPVAAEAVIVKGRGSLLADALRSWRLAEAKKKGIPAFRILTDKVLESIAETKPRSLRELLALSGMGPALVEKYGAQIFRIVERVEPAGR